MELLYLFSAHTLKMLDICIRFCESISKGFSVTDWNSRIDARVVANADGQKNGWKTRSLYHSMPMTGVTKNGRIFTYNMFANLPSPFN